MTHPISHGYTSYPVPSAVATGSTRIMSGDSVSGGTIDARCRYAWSITCGTGESQCIDWDGGNSRFDMGSSSKS